MSRCVVLMLRNASSVLDAIIELEHIVYEPARRDTREHLGTAFDEGIVIVAEERGRFVGMRSWVAHWRALPTFEVRTSTPCWDKENTLYAMATTVEPSMRGKGSGATTQGSAD